MKITAIICEINPYHNGHQYLFRQARREEDQILVAVMSGNFTQRGIPAIYDKYKRASLLVATPGDGSPSAADLVVELPFPWCSAGAEAFALGGVTVALGMGAEALVCGSEWGDTEKVYRAAEVKRSPAYLDRIRAVEKAEGRGEGSAVLFDAVMEEFGFSPGANDKLAMEYVRCLTEAGRSDVSLTAVLRLGGGETCKSATALRELIYAGKLANAASYIPNHAARSYGGFGAHTDLSRYQEIAFLYYRLFADERPFAEGFGGLHERLRKVAGEALSAEEFFRTVGTKKYTDARIRRAILFAMLKVAPELLKNVPAYTTLLAANGKGRTYLSHLRKAGTFPVITKPGDLAEKAATLPNVQQILVQARLAEAVDSIYTMCTPQLLPKNEFMKKHPHICP